MRFHRPGGPHFGLTTSRNGDRYGHPKTRALPGFSLTGAEGFTLTA